MRIFIYIILASVFLSSCGLRIAANEETKTAASPSPDKPAIRPPLPEPQAEPVPAQVLVAGKRWQSSVALSANAKNVLVSAFDSEPTAGETNAYDFAATKGNAGMDWWNFPWDLPSTRPQYTISYDDMKNMLLGVKVKPTKDSSSYISYSSMLAQMVEQLTPEIIYGHGAPRVTKIIYCVRNFLSVAIKHKLKEDANNMKKAAQKLISLHKNGLLKNDYLYKYDPKSKKPSYINNEPEDRDVERGIKSLELSIFLDNLPDQ